MTLIITGVGFLIHVYSNGYMDHEEDFPRYFAFLISLSFRCFLLVLLGICFFFCWMGRGGACLLSLDRFLVHKPAAAKAATKAFVINRIGDLGLLLGFLLTFYLFGTGDIAEISKRREKICGWRADYYGSDPSLFYWSDGKIGTASSLFMAS